MSCSQQCELIPNYPAGWQGALIQGLAGEESGLTLVRPRHSLSPTRSTSLWGSEQLGRSSARRQGEGGGGSSSWLAARRGPCCRWVGGGLGGRG